MRRSIVRSPGGGIGVFAINFASHGEIGLDLQRNLIGGELILTGGVSRPDAVTGASMTVHSRRNLYQDQSGLANTDGWNLIGGTLPPGSSSRPSTSTRFEMFSQDDTIREFDGHLRWRGTTVSSDLGPSASNRLEMELHGLGVQSAATDLTFFGARSFAAGVSPGDDNTVHLLLRQSTGSGPRANLFGDDVTISASGTARDRRHRETFVKTNETSTRSLRPSSSRRAMSPDQDPSIFALYGGSR